VTDAEVGRAVVDLKENVKSPNFVYAVGYSLEKVHSGVLCHILNHGDQGDPDRSLAASLWNLLSDGQEMPADDIRTVRACRERKIGPRTVGDMHIEIAMKKGETKHILCEYKVDGTGGHDDQCEQIRKAWVDNKNGNFAGETRFAFIVTGGARFWDAPSSSTGFKMLDLRAVRELFTSYTRVPLVRDYLSALTDEEVRGQVAHRLPDKYWDNRSLLGYRDRDWWYAYYDTLRHLLPDGMRWSIYSGGHNAVMCWEGSEDEATHDASFKLPDLGSLYCELNDASLKLKIAWDTEVQESLPVADRFYNAVKEASDLLAGASVERTSRRWKPRQQFSSWGKRTLPDMRDVKAVADDLAEFLFVGFPAVCRAVKRQLNTE
jgi:hypothetical protein